MLSLESRLVSQYICLYLIRILSIIDLVCCFHVSCVSKWSPRYLTCLVCVMRVPFNWIFDGFRFLSEKKQFNRRNQIRIYFSTLYERQITLQDGISYDLRIRFKATRRRRSLLNSKEISKIPPRLISSL